MRVVPSFACILLDLFAGLFRCLQCEFACGLLDSAAIGLCCIFLVPMSCFSRRPAQALLRRNRAIAIQFQFLTVPLPAADRDQKWRWIFFFALSLAATAALVWKARANVGPLAAWIGRLAANLSKTADCDGCETERRVSVVFRNRTCADKVHLSRVSAGVCELEAARLRAANAIENEISPRHAK